MTHRRILIAAFAPLLTVAVAGAQTPPAAGPAGALALRASQAFNKGDFAQALPLLRQEAAAIGTDPAAKDSLAVVQEQIRVCTRNLPPVAVAGGTPTTAPAAVSVLNPPTPSVDATRTPHPAPKPGQTLEMTIKELGNFDYDPDRDTPIPADVKALSGHPIKLHGFMVPLDQAENISKFALVPSLFGCCYGQPPQVQHTIVINCPKGKAVGYYPDEIIVEGKLDVKVMKDDGFVVGIFAVDAGSVKPAAK